ncbi:MAG: AAA family ATPase [Treponema sp.]|nr:AAA family ATPase [Treponema sp.]
MSKQNLPIGIQNFEEIRNGNYLYVDKTDLIYKLATEGKPYFLARPRRFGKSLLISTMKAYFEGRKDLFEGLKIAGLETKWEEHPVVHIDFGRNGYETNVQLKNYLDSVLSIYEKKYGITPKIDDYPIRLESILRTANERTGKKIVVLVDEYDKPMLDALNTGNYEPNRILLRNFYGVLKGCDEYLKFVFLTGITKFAKVSIFSELNQLNDISMDNEYNTICGISQAELDENFGEYIQDFADSEKISTEELMARLKKKYDGYHFSRKWKDVYNPFSLLNSFNKKEFDSYWFQTATPKMLFGLIEESNYDLTDILDGVMLKSSSFSDYRVGGGSLTPIIYHSGYLTIKDYDRETDLFTLGFPNEEVQDGFVEFLLPLYTNIPEDRLGLAVENFRKSIRTRDIESLMTLFSAAISDLPTRRKGNMEYAYQVAFHAMLRMTGFDVESEQQIIGGRIDVTLETGDTVYIFELKMDCGKDWSEVADAALEQIVRKGYPEKFGAGGKKIFKIAIVFSTEKGGVAGYRVVE